MSPIHAVLIVYLLISVPIFLLVFESSDLVVDEEFHLRQGKHYCHGNFHIWDEKITTLPGLYILSSLFLLPLNICSTFAFRLTSFFPSILNVLLIFEIRRSFQQKVFMLHYSFDKLFFNFVFIVNR